MNPLRPRRTSSPPSGSREPPKHATTDPRSTWVVASIAGLFLIALFHTLHVAKAVCLPITAALLLHFLLIPAVRALKRLRLPEPAGAALIMALVVAPVAFGITQLADPAGEWLEKGPAAVRDLKGKLRPMKQSVDQVSQTKEAINDLAQGSAAASSTPEVAVKAEWHAPVLQWTSEVAGQTGATLVLLFFLLASGDGFTEKFQRMLTSSEDRRCASDIFEGIEQRLSRFLLHSAIQNTGAGVVFGIGLWTMGIPNPALWGALTVGLQFIPYLGMIAVVGMVTIVAALTFEELWWIAAPGLYYGALMWIKAMFVTPTFLGRRLELNPVAVLTSLLLWSYLWGVPGTLLAVPLFAALKIVCDHVPRLQPLGELLGR